MDIETPRKTSFTDTFVRQCEVAAIEMFYAKMRVYPARLQIALLVEWKNVICDCEHYRNAYSIYIALNLAGK